MIQVYFLTHVAVKCFVYYRNPGREAALIGLPHFTDKQTGSLVQGSKWQSLVVWLHTVFFLLHCTAAEFVLLYGQVHTGLVCNSEI